MKINSNFFSTDEAIKNIFTVIFIFFISALTPLLLMANNVSEKLPSLLQRQIIARRIDYLPLSKISPFVIKAAVVSQDKRFYTNPGIDPIATLRALYFTFILGKRMGASTITEQLAKNIYYNDQDNLKTDIETKILALFITFHFSKSKIMEMYLNDIFYGKNCYGINCASVYFFHKKPYQLNIAQSAYLIGLVDQPSYLSTHPKRAVKQAEVILREMKNQQFS